jgi:tetratricopeptide (TPR) repeat protein
MDSSFRLAAFARRPPIFLGSLLVLALLGFWMINRLVHRFDEQKKALGRHLYQQSQIHLRKGQSDIAIDELRSALDYSPNDFNYQLALARVLRDTGKSDPARIGEAESYLISLWERDPQNSLVNLAIARLYASENMVEKSLQYYHNAIYGVWPEHAEAMRRETQLELIHFLLDRKADLQAQAELISWSSSLPPRDVDLHLTVADLFAQGHDYEHAFSEYQEVLHHDRNNTRALAGSGSSAFQLGRYRTAQRYLASAVPHDDTPPETKQLLETANLILQLNPYARRISSRETARRVMRIFTQAGQRLSSCAKEKNISLNTPSTPAPAHPAAFASSGSTTPATSTSSSTQDPLSSLYQRWLALKPGVASMRPETRDPALDISFEIEQRTAEVCGAPSGADQALLLLSQNPTGAER